MARKKTESPPTDAEAGARPGASSVGEQLDRPSASPPWTSPADDKKPMANNLLQRMENDFKYHAPKEGQPAKYEAIRAAGHTFAKLLADLCPEGRELSTAITHIENAVFWGNAAIARS